MPKIDLKQFIPAAWWEEGDTVRVYVYRAFRIPRATLKLPTIINLNHTRVVFLCGQLDYMDFSQALKFSDDGNMQFDQSKISLAHTDDGIFSCAFVLGKRAESEPIIRNRLSEAIALLAIANGRNIAFEKVFECSFEKNRISFVSPTVESPGWFPPPNIGANNN
jgi:hypothetical protein